MKIIENKTVYIIAKLLNTNIEYLLEYLNNSNLRIQYKRDTIITKEYISENHIFFSRLLKNKIKHIKKIRKKTMIDKKVKIGSIDKLNEKFKKSNGIPGNYRKLIYIKSKS
jgi:hypothetical protein